MWKAVGEHIQEVESDYKLKARDKVLANCLLCFQFHTEWKVNESEACKIRGLFPVTPVSIVSIEYSARQQSSQWRLWVQDHGRKDSSSAAQK